MISLRSWSVALLALFVTGSLAASLRAADAPGGAAYLLNVSKGQIPNDTGSDGLTKMSIEKSDELGGDALKVVFAAGDSFGDRQVRVKNWKPFATVRFDVFNPTKENVRIELSVNHRRTTSYQTRAVQAINLKPGKNSVQVGIDELLNVNGSTPDLANVVKWYINAESGKSPTLYFGSITLEGGEAAAAGGGAAGGGTGAVVPGSVFPSGGLRVQGTVGNLKVDLTITPLAAAGAGAAQSGAPAAGAAPAAKAPEVTGDPARLARIRAAKMPKVDKVIAFDTPEADAILAALEVYPPNNPWNLDVSSWPLHAGSRELVATIGADKPFRLNYDMGFVIVPPDQKRVELKVVDYPGESDKGPFPIPGSVPIEGWPRGYAGKGLSLEDVQRNKLKEQGDRHAIVLDPTNRMLYEFFVMRKTDGGWEAAQSSVFDLKTNKLRPDGWTSADAAGLPIFPAVVRYDELKRGAVEHALRVTIPRSRKEYVYPATHHAGHGTAENLPRMGERLRLKADFDTAGFTPEVQAILKCLKKYGMFVADNGISWAISVAPDPRMPDMSAELRKLKGSDFEVVQPPTGYRPPVDD